MDPTTPAPEAPTKHVQFVALRLKEPQRWAVLVDEEVVIDEVRDLDVSSRELAPLWKLLGLRVTFEDGHLDPHA